MIFSAFFLFGSQKAKKLKKRYTILKDTQDGINLSKKRLEVYHLPEEEVLSGGIFDVAREYKNLKFKDAIEKSTIECEFLNQEDKNLILAFSKNLGNESIDEEVKTYEIFISSLEGLVEKAEKEYREKAPLYRRCMCLLGAFAAIIFL